MGVEPAILCVAERVVREWIGVNDLPWCSVSWCCFLRSCFEGTGVTTFWLRSAGGPPCAAVLGPGLGVCCVLFIVWLLAGPWFPADRREANECVDALDCEDCADCAERRGPGGTGVPRPRRHG